MRSVILLSTLFVVTHCFGQFKVDRKCNTTFDFGVGFQSANDFLGPNTSIRWGYKSLWVELQYNRGQRFSDLQNLNITNRPSDFTPLGKIQKSDVGNLYPELSHDFLLNVGWRTKPRSWGWFGMGTGIGWNQVNRWDHLTLLHERNSPKAIAFNNARDTYNLQYTTSSGMVLPVLINTQFSFNKWLALYLQGTYLINFSGNSRPAIAAGLRFGKMY